VGFEPTNGGFADLSLGPLGYRAKQPSIAKLPLGPGRRPPLPSSSDSLYFCAATSDGVIFASRRKRADSSGGVGLI
jgi:hypothetical protein